MDKYYDKKAIRWKFILLKDQRQSEMERKRKCESMRKATEGTKAAAAALSSDSLMPIIV
jgi:hypothetical protein